MFDPTAMVIADKATRRHLLLSPRAAHAPAERPQRRHGQAMRRLSVVALRRLADRLEPRRGNTVAPVS